MGKNILVTGGAGFIGTNYVELLLRDPENKIYVIDKMTYASNTKILDKPIKFYRADICFKTMVDAVMEQVDEVVHFAAESHVDRSIQEGNPFIDANVKGTYILLKSAQEHGIEKFIHISTDEVYGSVDYPAEEIDKLNPGNPYSASKAAAEHLVNSFINTYNFPAIITRSTNNYGPYQHEEKFIPTVIKNAIKDKKIPIYGDGINVRDWLYVMDNCKAIELVRQKGEIGEIYNIGAKNERLNLDVALLILEYLKKSKDLINFVEDRLGHDLKYSVDVKKITKLGWKPETDFIKGLHSTINWYVTGNYL